MQYISHSSFGREVVETVSLTQAAVRSRRRAVSDPEAALAAIAAELIVPSQLSVEGSPSNTSLVRLGFTLKLPPDVVLEWVRFLVSVDAAADAKEGTREPARVLAVYPPRVQLPMTVTGRIAVDENGKLTREEVAGTRDPNTAVSYAPFVVGSTTPTGEAVWMWLPAHQAPPVGSDALFMSISAGTDVSIVCRRSLHAAVRHVDTPDYVVVEKVAKPVAVPAAPEASYL
jgi:hypothetical protein